MYDLSLALNIYAKSPIPIQNLLITAYGHQWKNRRFGGVFPVAYKAAKERELFAETQWFDYQNSQLKKLLLHAYQKIPFYNRKFREYGLIETGLHQINIHSLHKLPVLSKEELRQFGTSSMLATTRESKGEFFASSGSTGTPTQILFSHAMHQRWFALFEARVRNWAGVDSFTPRGMIGGRRIIADAESKAPFYRYNFFEKQVYFSAYHINQPNAKDYLYGMNKHHVQYMTGYAMSNFFLARFFEELNIEVPQLKAVITSSEKLTAEMRSVFSKVYGCKTYDGWSGVEACGLISECEHGSLHVSPDAGIIEVLDDAMQPVEAGVAGTVYCTGFLNYDQPLIRYNIGDKIILSSSSCSCGRNMPVVKEIVGRTEDVVIGRDGREMVRFHSIFNGLTTIKKAQIIQENLDDIIVKVVIENRFLQKEKMLIEDRIKSQLGDINVFIEEVDNIPLTANGKFKAVVSKIERKREVLTSEL